MITTRTNKWKIEVEPRSRWGDDSPVVYVATLREAKRARTLMATQQGLFNHGVTITRVADGTTR